jgi:hypothetical protein
MDRYIGTLYQIVTAGQKTNSYKFALWRALTRLAPSTDGAEPVISKYELAPLFVEYYWPLKVRYHLRQGIDPDKDPVVMKRVRDLLHEGHIGHGDTLQEFEKKEPERHKTLLAQVTKEAFDDVIPRFHTVRGKPIAPSIYNYTGSEGRVGDLIELTPKGRRFLIEYRRLIDFVAVSGWVRFAEQFTSAPKLHEKIEGAKVQRAAVSQWRNALLEMQNGRCFSDETHNMSSPEVDHVLPWSFVLEDKTWNLVLACRKCNNAKRDRLTDVGALELLCSREDKILKSAIKVDAVFSRHFDEWHSRNLTAYVKSLYDQAVADGFPSWA